jgi:hypothetical protein
MFSTLSLRASKLALGLICTSSGGLTVGFCEFDDSMEAIIFVAKDSPVHIFF